MKSSECKPAALPVSVPTVERASSEYIPGRARYLAGGGLSYRIDMAPDDAAAMQLKPGERVIVEDGRDVVLAGEVMETGSGALAVRIWATTSNARVQLRRPRQ